LQTDNTQQSDYSRSYNKQQFEYLLADKSDNMHLDKRRNSKLTNLSNLFDVKSTKNSIMNKYNNLENNLNSNFDKLHRVLIDSKSSEIKANKIVVDTYYK